MKSVRLTLSENTEIKQNEEPDAFKAADGVKLTIYNQWCEDYRALQNVFWRVPFFAMTITGGLGAAILAFDGPIDVKRYLLFFIAVCNTSFIFIAWRVRRVMETLLIKIFAFEGITKPESKFFVLRFFILLFGVVSFFSIYTSIWAEDSWFIKPVVEKSSPVGNEGAASEGSVIEGSEQG